MKKLLSLVLDEETNSLRIDGSNLSYVDSETGETNIVMNLDSDSRPLFLSELNDRLKKRRYHLVDKLIIEKTSGNLGMLVDNPASDSEVEFSGKLYNYTSGDSINICDTEISSDDIDNFINSYYKNIMEVKESGVITLYNSSKMVVDILDGLISFDLVDPDEYTNTISLIGIEKKAVKPNLSGKIDLTVKYSKGGTIYLQDLTFTAFKYSSDENSPTISSDTFVSSIGDISNPDVLIEYIDGVIRTIPESSDVDECIVSNCVLTYGCI